jgi:hypothetical protein
LAAVSYRQVLALLLAACVLHLIKTNDQGRTWQRIASFPPW